jgi:hypothetical protein
MLVGLLGFIAAAGLRILDPSNIAWLSQGDFATQYLGWQFFRSGPWLFPPGANPAYGMELGSSVVYSDSIPGLALIFKALEPALSPAFQYFGLWLLACFVLQALMAWKLIGLISTSPIIRISACALFVFAPPFLFRVTMHLALAGHWLILAALYLALRPTAPRSVLAWSALLFTSSLVHAYLFVMVAAIWAANYVGHLLVKADWRAAVGEPVLALVPSALGMWLCGYFVLVPDSGAAPLGGYRMNLLSIVDPDGWSHVLRPLPKPGSSSEGLNFLGLGAILLILFWLPLMRKGALGEIPRRLVPLGAVAILLTVFALSNHIALGTVNLFDVPLPDWAERALSTFQSSGRFFWPVFYGLLLLIVWLVAKNFQPHVPAALLLCAAYAQVLDTSAGWLPRRALMQAQGEHWTTSLKSPFWAAAGNRYAALRWLPPENHSAHWRDLAYYAARHGMATNAVYLARLESNKLHDSRARATQSTRESKFDANTLYVLDERYAREAAWRIRSGNDVLTRVDGLAVLAPAWRSCATCPQLSEIRPADLLPTPGMNEKLAFTAGGSGEPFLALGWSQPTSEGVWAGGRWSSLVLPLPAPTRAGAKIEFSAWTHVGREDGNLTVRCYVNGQYAGDIVFTRSRMHPRFALNIPAQTIALSRNGIALIELEILPPTALAEFPRQPPGFRLIEARISAASPAH